MAEDEAPDFDPNAKQPPLEREHIGFSVVSINPLGAYRTVMAARGLRDINDRLAEGWELIMGEFCEEVLQRSATSRLPTATTYRPYALLGKRDPLILTDRAALADAEDRAATEAAIPLTAEPPTAAPPQPEAEPAAEPAAEPQGETEPQPMGAKAQPHRTASADRDGFQPVGGLRDRR
jgi:hypothetical protein